MLPTFEGLGRWLLAIGVALVVIGGIILLLSRLGIKNFPGVLRFEWQGVTCVVPLLASILLSIVLTVILNLIIRLFNR